MHKEIRYFETKLGRKPFIEAIEALKDRTLRAQVHNRLARVALGNYGDVKSLGDEILELRIHYGGGYRIYFTEIDKTIVLLLMAGPKRTQSKDIKIAKTYWFEFRRILYEST
jgi:putative addiction module killer protein